MSRVPRSVSFNDQFLNVSVVRDRPRPLAGLTRESEIKTRMNIIFKVSKNRPFAIALGGH